MSIRTLTVGLVLAAAFVCTKPVRADARPPRFDFDALCTTRALTPEGFSPETKTACLATQDEAFDVVRRLWPSILTSIQDDCSYEAKAEGDGDYQVLEACLRAQLRQQQSEQGARPKAKPATPPK